MKQDIRLLIIDPQRDFCDPAVGSLYVPGADEDMGRVAEMIERLQKRIKRIVVSLDQHHERSIFHPMFWRDSKGNHPEPYTIITLDDFNDGVWNTSDPRERQWALEYLTALKTDDPTTGRKGGRYPLCIWPYHCLIGTTGATIVNPLRDALSNWCKSFNRQVDYVAKGSNYRTEHYRIVKREVYDPTDSSTGLNTGLIQMLEEADIIGIMGEARDYCVANTVRDIMDNFGDPKYINKLWLLTDATNDVKAPGAEHIGEEFIEEFLQRGGNQTTTVDFLR